MSSSTPTDRPPSRQAAIEQTAADWLAQRDADNWTSSKADALESWLIQDPTHRVAFLRLEAVWQETARLRALGAGLARAAGVPARGHWKSHLHRYASAKAEPGPGLETLEFALRPSPPRRSRLRLAAATLGIVLVVIATGLGWQHLNAVDTQTHRTALGVIETVVLADGSRTTLASHSLIDVHLSRRERRVDLRQGEAYFEISKDPDRPFVVQAGERRVVAVGTRFSVRRDGAALRVVATEGVVRLESQADGTQAQPATLLPAGSLALARPGGVLVRALSLAEAAQLVEWRSGMLVFQDITLAEAASEFNRYNSRKIVIEDDAISTLRIGGSFRWENAEAFVRLLEQGFPIRADYRRDRIVLHASR